ncbi:hypothetical protein BJ165DRAFT_1532128 [Panaeolus papilionaceus]|nr:hypothetical protein BJ165DRAFT_1532128 [Panaeolus papilionaceus]
MSLRWSSSLFPAVGVGNFPSWWFRFKEPPIRSILPDAAQQLIDNHDPVNGPRPWLPCIKQPHTGNFIVSRASGPFTGSVMQNIMLSGKQRGISTTKICISDDSEVSDTEAAVAGPSTLPAKSAKSGSHLTQPSKLAAPSDRVLRPKQPKKSEIIAVSSSSSFEADSDGSVDWHTEPAFSRGGTPQDDLDRSFSGIHLDFPLPHDCHPELPAEAAFCSSP